MLAELFSTYLPSPPPPPRPSTAWHLETKTHAPEQTSLKSPETTVMSFTATSPTAEPSSEAHKRDSAAGGSTKITTNQPVAPAATHDASSVLESRHHRRTSQQLDEPRQSQPTPPNPRHQPQPQQQQQQPPSQRNINHEENRRGLIHLPPLQSTGLSSQQRTPQTAVGLKGLWEARDRSDLQDPGTVMHKPISLTVIQATQRWTSTVQDDTETGGQKWHKHGKVLPRVPPR